MSYYKYNKFQVNLFLFFKLTEFVVMFTETQFGVNLNSFQVNSKEFQDIFVTLMNNDVSFRVNMDFHD